MTVPLVRSLLAALALASLAGCGAEPPVAAAPADPPPAGAAYEPARCGRVVGRVTWAGAVPDVPTYAHGTVDEAGKLNFAFPRNPHVPRVDPVGRGLHDAVVFLRGVPPAAKPWDLPPASVELSDRLIRVRQGDGEPRRAGFVRRGAEVSMVSREAVFHSLRGRGAAFFSLAFPEPDRPLARAFDRVGLVHLTSGAGFYWASAFLFVDEHPYYAATDREGRFAFDGVPAGPVEVVAWHPHWKATDRVRDPESGAYSRQAYAEPLEATARVAVRAGETATADVSLSEK